MPAKLPLPLRMREPEALSAAREEVEASAAFHASTQWMCEVQWTGLRRYDYIFLYCSMSNASAKSITKNVANESCFIINYLYSTLWTVWNAYSTTITFFFIYFYNFSFCHIINLCNYF